ncbi:Mannose-6-phosphate isomerase [Entophlyctis sp. JEL0112]|nr:Mannose-6-phosphate isomerase [Entophlyctis sp. JEL0112]
MDASGVSRLSVLAQSYEWGRVGTASRACVLACADPAFVPDPARPYAELWMGTHPNAPSRIFATSEPLKATLNAKLLGTGVAARFAGDLPFLFKVLSIGKALSIQAHPDKALAQRLMRERPDLYKDANHKPEMAVALTPFEALIGFRSIPEIQENLRAFPEFAAAVGSAAAEPFLATAHLASGQDAKAHLKAVFSALMNSDPTITAAHVKSLAARLNALEQRNPVQELLIRLDSEFPGDVGVFCALLLNYLKLNEGEAIFLAANEPHAYLSGDCVECMAASDNVVRSGLTPKFKDVKTLVNMLTYNHGPADLQILKGDPYKGSSSSVLYDPPIEEFSILRTSLKNGSEKFAGIDGPSILIVTSGKGTLLVGGDALQAGLGYVFFIGAGVPVELRSAEGSDEAFTVYRAFCV